MQVLEGIRVVEVDNWGFSPSAGTVLADWGADVIKVEPPTGDPLRHIFGTVKFLGKEGMVNFMHEQWNRNKRSIGLDLTTAWGRAALDELLVGADVFLTNYLPDLRTRLRLLPDDVRAVQPDLVYALATGQGSRGPDAAKPSFDYASAWARAGVGRQLTAEGAPFALQRPGFVDTTAGNFLAGAVAAALVKKGRTGDPVDVEVSLLAAGGWMLGPDISNVLSNDFELPLNSGDGRGAGPLMTWYECADGKRLVFTMLHPERYYSSALAALELDWVLTDERFDSPEKRAAANDTLHTVFSEQIRSRRRSYWADRLNPSDVVWAPVQSPTEYIDDVQVVANGYILTTERADGSTVRVQTSPAQFDNEPIVARWAAPDVGQHTDEILGSERGWDAARIAAARTAGWLT